MQEEASERALFSVYQLYHGSLMPWERSQVSTSTANIL